MRRGAPDPGQAPAPGFRLRHDVFVALDMLMGDNVEFENTVSIHVTAV